MATDWRERLRAQRARAEAEIKQRTAELSHGAHVLEALGRQAYADAIKTGQNVVARTPAEVRALGLAVVQGKLPQAIAEVAVKKVAPTVITATQRASAKVRSKIGEPGSYQRQQAVAGAKQQARAAASGFTDEVTFGQGDRVLSAGDALMEGGLSGWGDRYADHMATKRAEDASDAQNYGLARAAGRVAGVGTTIAVLGAPATLRSVASALPRGAELVHILGTSRYGLDPRGLNALAAAGGASAGVVSQGASDVLSNRPSSWRDYAGAALGGVADGLATVRLGPVIGGAVGGATSRVAQDQLSGRITTADELINSGRTSAVLGGVAGAAGATGANLLPTKVKGELGEFLSAAKTVARGDGVPFNLRRRLDLAGGGHTFTDLQFVPRKAGKKVGVGEAKLGPKANLQRDNFRRRRSPTSITSWTDGSTQMLEKPLGRPFRPLELNSRTTDNSGG